MMHISSKMKISSNSYIHSEKKKLVDLTCHLMYSLVEFKHLPKIGPSIRKTKQNIMFHAAFGRLQFF